MKYVLFICLTILLFNCKNTDQAYIQTIIQEWTNKKIIFPDDIQAKIVGRDTNCNYLLLKPIKILVYVDSIGCTACKLNFYDWYQKINSLGKITDLAFLFYVNTKNFKILTNAIKTEGFNYPVFYDTHNILAKTNHFPKNSRFNTFLLDKENKVVLIGDPLGREKMWELYIQTIDSLSKSLKSIH
ncbi:MAG: hypothetical protein ACLU30_00215 [Odoribacter splanchnicus]|jgi:hypothetical protein